ncbi:MAG: hypothetical protein WC498_00735 [Candidatus Saccharimonadales bacterium]
MPSRHASSVSYSLEELGVPQALRQMEQDGAYNTESSYSPNSMLYPDNQMPFSQKHIAYLKAHPKLDPVHYLANLRLMIRRR